MELNDIVSAIAQVEINPPSPDSVEITVSGEVVVDTSFPSVVFYGTPIPEILEAREEAINAITPLVTQATTASEQANVARSQAQSSAQAAAASQTACQSALTSTLAARDATLLAASEVGALDLARANLAVKRQNMKFFNLNIF
jgi:hypothetical protein